LALNTFIFQVCPLPEINNSLTDSFSKQRIPPPPADVDSNTSITDSLDVILDIMIEIAITGTSSQPQKASSMPSKRIQPSKQNEGTRD